MLSVTNPASPEGEISLPVADATGLLVLVDQQLTYYDLLCRTCVWPLWLLDTSIMPAQVFLHLQSRDISMSKNDENANKDEATAIERLPPIMDEDAWGQFVENARDELEQDPNFPDANYGSLTQSDHPNCKVQTGVNNTGLVGPTGFVVCNGKSVRRVLQVPRD